METKREEHIIRKKRTFYGLDTLSFEHNVRFYLKLSTSLNIVYGISTTHFAQEQKFKRKTEM